MKYCSLLNQFFFFSLSAQQPHLASLPPLPFLLLLSSLFASSFFSPSQRTQSHHKLDGRQLNELSEDSLTAITRCVGIHVERGCPALLISRQMSHFLSYKFRGGVGNVGGRWGAKKVQEKLKEVKQEKTEGRFWVKDGKKRSRGTKQKRIGGRMEERQKEVIKSQSGCNFRANARRKQLFKLGLF